MDEGDGRGKKSVSRFQFIEHDEHGDNKRRREQTLQSSHIEHLNHSLNRRLLINILPLFFRSEDIIKLRHLEPNSNDQMDSMYLFTRERP